MSLLTGRRARLVAIVAVAFAAFTGLVVLAALPTGADTPSGVVPEGARLAAEAPVEDAVVLVLSQGGRLRAQVAYEGPKGWLGVVLDGETGDDATVASRASTGGGGPVPALTAVFGTAAGAGAEVDLVWADGEREAVVPGRDGTWLAVRPGVVAVESVTVTRDGAVLAEAVDL